MPMCTTGAGPVLGGASGPTVLLDLAWTGDLLNSAGEPMDNGEEVYTLNAAVGGTATRAAAIAAGASRGPEWNVTNGMHTGGLNSALTFASPLVIPADTDCVIYAVVKLQSASQVFALGDSAGQGTRLEIGGDGDIAAYVQSDTGNQVMAYWGTAPTTVMLYRFRRSESTWYAARTGDAEQAMTLNSGLATVSIEFDTLLGFNLSGGGVDSFSATGDYLQKVRIITGSSSPDTAYETANGGVL